VLGYQIVMYIVFVFYRSGKLKIVSNLHIILILND